MRKTKNTIKINGHTYDAFTGELLHSGQADASTSINQPVQPIAGTVIAPSKPAKHVKPAAHHTSKSDKIKTRQKAKPATCSPQHSKTLMRHSVKKPTPSLKSSRTPQHRTSTPVKATAIVAVKPSAKRVDEKRLQHAKQIQKSRSINKFNQSSTPVSQNHTLQKHPTATHKASPRTKSHLRPTHHRPAARQKTSADILQQALHHANSHTQPAPKRRKTTSRRRRVANLSAAVVVAGVLVGVAVFQSIPSIKMRIAGAKAGFAAGLPGYSPAGFHMGNLEYGAGVVAMSYKSNSDKAREFSITQKASAWDSNALRDLFVAKADRNFRTVEDGGRTIYLYGQHNATWVDQGIWYQVQGASSLSDRQLIDIAKSL